MKKTILAGTPMNYITLLAILLIGTLFGCAGMERATDANKSIEFVLEAPNKTKDQIFSASKSWIAETFVSGKSVIDDADKDSGRIIAKGRIKHPCIQGTGCILGKMIGFTLRIDAKDGKIKTTYSNPTVISPPTSGYSIGLAYTPGSPESENAIWMRGDMEDAKKAFQDLSGELKSYVANESAGTKNW